jgi:hypothetical protein
MNLDEYEWHYCADCADLILVPRAYTGPEYKIMCQRCIDRTQKWLDEYDTFNTLLGDIVIDL